MKIKDYIAHKGISLTDFAQQVGCGVPTLHDLVTGRRLPSVRLALKIQKASAGKIGLKDFDHEAAA